MSRACCILASMLDLGASVLESSFSTARIAGLQSWPFGKGSTVTARFVHADTSLMIPSLG